MSGIRRINFFSGPGCGKSTLAARIFAELKVRGHDVEHISEFIKVWAHEGRYPQSYDQLYVFAKQIKAEDTILRNVGTIITDSPILMNTAYSGFYGFVCAPYLIEIAQQFDRDFPALNFFIERTVPYVSSGRYQSEQEALDFDDFLLRHLGEHLEGKIYYIRADEIDRIMSIIEKKGFSTNKTEKELTQCRDLSRLKKLKQWFKKRCQRPS